jgi:23S rRNA (uridine2552-2'-O)-methyltransferase
MTVIDLGAAPGGWSQYVAQCVGRQGRVIANDIKPMASLDCVKFIQGDLEEERVIEQLLAVVGKNKVDIILSDMAPNATGVISIDQPRALAFAELALELVQYCLKKEGHFLVKLFQGTGFDEFIGEVRALFTQINVTKPNASRAHSREIYLLGLRRL